jgi:hypothetical protein
MNLIKIWKIYIIIIIIIIIIIRKFIVVDVYQTIQGTIIFAFKYLLLSFNIKILKESKNIIGIWSSSICKRKHSRKIRYRV